MISVDDEALAGQRQGALLAVEAVLVPGEAFVVHHVGAVAEPCRDTGTRRQGHPSVSSEGRVVMDAECRPPFFQNLLESEQNCVLKCEMRFYGDVDVSK